MRRRISLLHLAVSLALCLAAVRPTAGQGLTQVDRDRGQAMLGGLHWVMDTLYHDTTVLGDGTLGAELWWRARQAINRAPSWASILLSLATYLDGFNDSHTTFLPPRLTMEVQFGFSWRVVGEDCLVTAVERNGAAARGGLAPGDRLLEVDGIHASPRNMAAIWYAYHLIAPRRSIRLHVEAPDGVQRAVDVEGRVRQRPATTDYGNLDHVRAILDEAARGARVNHRWQTRDSIAMWRFNAFGLRDRRIESQLREARRFPWLIIDLRGNSGGVLETLRGMLGLLFDEPFAGFTQQWRDSTTTFDVTPGRDAYRGNLVVLVDRESASSAEILAFIVQQRGRGQVVGDRTAGAVRTAIRWDLEDHRSGQFFEFGMFVSVADIVMHDGTKLEGLGVTPDVVVLPTAHDIANGRDPVLQQALALAGLVVTAEEAGRLLR